MKEQIIMKHGIKLLFLLAIFISGCVNAPTDNTANNPTSPAKADPNKKVKIGFCDGNRQRRTLVTRPRRF